MGEPRADRPLDAPGRGSVRGKVVGVLAWRSRLVPTGLRVGAAKGRGHEAQRGRRGLQRPPPGPCTARPDGSSEAGVGAPGRAQPVRGGGGGGICYRHSALPCEAEPPGAPLPEPHTQPSRRLVLCPQGRLGTGWRPSRAVSPALFQENIEEL